MTNFAEFGLPSAILAALERMQIVTPTPVQSKTIPIALEGSDILASAQTGTGKTIAYLIPLVAHLMKEPQRTALVLAPTRELATQVHEALWQITRGSSFKMALLIGGAPMLKQIMDLKKKPQIIVGTPGRIMDHLDRKSLSLAGTKFLVIDEADRMLDMGFGVQLDKIAEYLPQERQTLMFSATFPPNIDRLAKKYLSNPQRVAIDTVLKAAPKIKQETMRIRTSEKQANLVQQLEQREGSIIIFVRTKRRAETLSDELQELGHKTTAMHGDLPQRRRDQVIRAFRTSKSRILVATDVAARGLDIPHVMHVINYDLPECPEDYVHRIGRTGRADAEGFALSFIAPEDNQKWRAISRLLDPKAQDEEREHSERRDFARGPARPSRPRQESGSAFEGSRRPFSGGNSRFNKSERSFDRPQRSSSFQYGEAPVREKKRFFGEDRQEGSAPRFKRFDDARPVEGHTPRFKRFDDTRSTESAPRFKRFDDEGPSRFKRESSSFESREPRSFGPRPMRQSSGKPQWRSSEFTGSPGRTPSFGGKSRARFSANREAIGS